MNLFAQIEGLRQEDMATALLRYLVVGSPEIRDTFIRFLSDHSRKGPLVSESFFSCLTEFATEDDDGGRGRVDMLLTMDGAVIGIENKVDAAFQDKQPQKYRPRLKKIAQGQQAMFGGEVGCQIFTLVPRSRRHEAHLKELAKERDYPVVYWEELVDRLSPLTDTLADPDMTMVLKQFLDYLNGVFGFMPEYRQIFPHTRTDWEEKGTPLQKHFMRSLWRFLPAGGARLSQGDDFMGYNFFHDNPDIDGWAGFISTKRLIHQEGNRLKTEHQAELVISASCAPDEYDRNPEEYGLIPIELTSKWWFASGRPPRGWIVNFDKDWDTAERWHRCLAPLAGLAASTGEQQES